MSGDEAADWSVLVPRFALLIHPTKVLIVEAMIWIEDPVSPAQLAKSFDKDPDLAHTAYHLREMYKLGLVERAGERRIRGATEKFFRLTGLRSGKRRGG